MAKIHGRRIENRIATKKLLADSTARYGRACWGRSAGIFTTQAVLPTNEYAAVRRCYMRRLAHDPEKWEPVFGKDHAQAKC
jgi:hypothetical protein